MGPSAASFDFQTGLGWSPWLFYAGTYAVMWLAGLGVTLGYHRVLTHRAAKLSRPIEYLLITFGSPAGTPVQWIGNHRHHHAVTDTVHDEHSPQHHGFWVAHAGWYLETQSTTWSVLYTFAGPLRMLFDAFWRPRTNQQYIHLARDIAKDPYYRWLSSGVGYAAVQLIYLTLAYGVTFIGFGIWYVVLLSVIHVVFYAIGDLVNSAAHLWGRKTFATHDQSRDLGWLGWLAFGDGYHNGHHAFPNSIRSGFGKTDLDLSYWACVMLAKLSLAADLKLPRAQDLEAKRITTCAPSLHSEDPH